MNRKVKQHVITVATGALSESFAPLGDVVIRQITAHASASVNNALNFTIDSRQGAKYDTLVATVSSGWQNALISDLELYLSKDGAVGADALLVACTNAGNAEIGITITYEEL